MQFDNLCVELRTEDLAGPFGQPEKQICADAEIGRLQHCDARGVYSDVDDPSFRTVGRKFLRGYQISDMEAAAPTVLDPLLNPKGLWNVVWVMGGTNDEDHVDVPTTINRLLSFARQRHQVGWKVIIVTLPSRVNGDAFKNQFNAYLRANWPSFADQIVDLGAVPQIGADFAYRDPTYFLPDGYHLTAAGYAYFSAAATDALNRLLATPFCAP